jgi:hypothetical protein
MPVITPCVQEVVHAVEQIHAIASNLRHCEELSEMVAFVADMAAGKEGAVVLSDADVCARVWRGIAGVHAQIRESLVLAQIAAEQLQATVVDCAKHGGR